MLPSFLGRAGSAIALAREGARVAVADRDEAALDHTRQATEAAGGEAFALPLDLSETGTLDGQVGTVGRAFGPVTILVNNTGGPPPTPAGGQDPALWRTSFESVVLSVIALTDRVLPGMRAAGWGRVVTSTSSGVVAPIPNLGASNALRLSLVGWSKTLAREVARDGITCNVVLPGRVATDCIRFLDEARAKREDRSAEEVAAESTSSIPLGRYGPPKSTPTLSIFSRARASYVTGSVLRVDGGLIASI